MIWALILLCFCAAYTVAQEGKSGAAWSFGLLGAGLLLFRLLWPKRRSYPEGRSKAHGATKELLRSAQAKERELLLTPERRLLSNGEIGEWSKWERVCDECRESGQGGFVRSTLLQIEALPTGWTALVELRSGGTLEQAQSAKSALESALKLRRGAVEMEQDEERHAGVILLRVTPERTVTARPVPWAGPAPDVTILKPVQLGTYQDGGPLTVTLAYQSALVAGATDAGKSGTLHVLVAHVARSPDASLWTIDLKGGVELGLWEEAADMVATDVDGGVELLRQAQRLIDHRYALLPRGQRKWVPTPRDPHVIIPVDEARVLSTSEEAVKLMGDITGRGRAAAVTMILSTQYPTVEAIGSSLIVTQCNVRVCLRVNSSREANVILGSGMVGAGWNAHQIPKDQPGTLYLHAAGATIPRLARAFYATDAKIEQVAAECARLPRPRLVVTSRPGSVSQPRGTGLDGGGEDPKVAQLRSLLADAGPDGIHREDLAHLTGRSLPWVEKWLPRVGAENVSRGYWRAG